tara:strand:- start:53 stop:337 length:285 start_codon:yes stop_codon:yes gene_type:complete
MMKNYSRTYHITHTSLKGEEELFKNYHITHTSHMMKILSGQLPIPKLLRPEYIIRYSALPVSQISVHVAVNIANTNKDADTEVELTLGYILYPI